MQALCSIIVGRIGIAGFKEWKMIGFGVSGCLVVYGEPK